MVVGTIELLPLVDAVGELGELDELFPDVPAETWDRYGRLYPQIVAGSRWRIPCTCYLLRSAGHTVLVDTGVGPAGLWGWDAEREEGLLPALRAAGVGPDDVNVVFLTHLHVDHVGWNSDRAGAVVFPRARYVTHPDGVAFALASDRPHVGRCVSSLLALGVVDQVAEESELAHGVSTISLPGHFPGHMGVRIDSDGARAVLLADTAVHPLLLDEPERTYVSDADAEECTATRRRVLPELVDRDVLVACGHYPDGGIGRVVRRDGHVVWEAARMTPWPRDDAKLDRVRALMGEQGLDAIVARAPDNVLYLTNFWSMKGYDAVVFPREGEPTLLCLEASADDAARTAWTRDVRLVAGYDPADPRPPGARTLDRAVEAAREHGIVGLELSLGTQASDRMVGEPTTFTKSWFDAFPDARDATPLLAEARAVKTEQELERMRLANEIAAAAMEHVQGVLRPGMTEAHAAAEWQGFVHGEGTGWKGKVDLALGFSLVWSGPGIKTFTATTSRPVVEGEPTLFEIWVCADGYWCDHTKNLVPGELDARYVELEHDLLEVYEDAVGFSTAGASMAELDRRTREGLARMGFPDQPTHPVAHGVGARAHEPPYAHQAGGGELREGMVLAIEPGCYWPEGGGLRVEDNWLVTTGAPEKLCPFPDGIVRA